MFEDCPDNFTNPVGYAVCVAQTSPAWLWVTALLLGLFVFWLKA